MIEVSPNASVTLDGSGNGQVSLGPPSGAVWRLRLASVSTTSAVKQPQAFLYRGSTSGPTEQIDSTFLGNSASSGKVAGAPFFQGQVLWAKWTGGDAGAIATLQAYGQQGRREELPFDSAAVVGEGFPLSVATVFQAGNTIIDASGDFVYSGPPGPGNASVLSIVAPGVTADPFGNPVKAVMLAGPAAGPAVVIDQFGDIESYSNNGTIGIEPGTPRVVLYNSSGAPVMILDGARQAMFTYSPAAGLGNLIASIAPLNGTDAAGNAGLAGTANYTKLGPGVYMAIQTFGGEITWLTAATEAGPWTSQGALAFNGTGFGLTVNAPYVDFGPSSPILGELVAVQPGTTYTAETWHTISSLPTGWTALGAGVRYRLLTDNSVRIQVSAAVGATAASGTVALFTLPAGYVPANQFRGCAPGTFANGTPSATCYNSRFQVTTGGAVQILGFPGGAPGGLTEIDGQWDVPLD